MEVEKVACGFCRKEFEPSKHFKKYCSVECQKKAAYRRATKSRYDGVTSFHTIERESAKENARSRKMRERNHRELIKVSQEARAVGMSYGKYVAMLAMEGTK